LQVKQANKVSKSELTLLLTVRPNALGYTLDQFKCQRFDLEADLDITVESDIFIQVATSTPAYLYRIFQLIVDIASMMHLLIINWAEASLSKRRLPANLRRQQELCIEQLVVAIRHQHHLWTFHRMLLRVSIWHLNLAIWELSVTISTTLVLLQRVKAQLLCVVLESRAAFEVGVQWQVWIGRLEEGSTGLRRELRMLLGVIWRVVVV
jgi:hypothetical protein